MAELNFIVDNNAIEVVRQTELKANFTEMKAALTEFCEPYKHLIVSEDAISQAKADRAKVRSVANHIDEYRKFVKKAYTEPLKVFEDKCKELTALCDEASDNIDEQVKAYEAKRKEEKIFLLKDYYDHAEKKYPAYAQWEFLYNEKWGNVTYSLDKAHKDIDNGIATVDREVTAILALHSEWQLSLLDKYKQTHDMVEVLSLHERLAASKEAEILRKKEQEERERQEALRREEEAKAQAQANAQNVEYVPEEEWKELDDPKTKEQLYVATFSITGTYPEIVAFKDYLRKHLISFTMKDVAATDNPFADMQE